MSVREPVNAALAAVTRSRSVTGLKVNVAVAPPVKVVV
jgi:hypothetical protein